MAFCRVMRSQNFLPLLVGAGVVDVLSRFCVLRQGDSAEHKLRALIALRSISRFHDCQSVLVGAGVVKLALQIVDDEDRRTRGQALGLLYNVVGFTAVAPLEVEEEDEFRYLVISFAIFDEHF